MPVRNYKIGDEVVVTIDCFFDRREGRVVGTTESGHVVEIEYADKSFFGRLIKKRKWFTYCWVEKLKDRTSERRN